MGGGFVGWAVGGFVVGFGVGLFVVGLNDGEEVVGLDVGSNDGDAVGGGIHVPTSNHASCHRVFSSFSGSGAKPGWLQ